jgi:signal peptidase II
VNDAAPLAGERSEAPTRVRWPLFIGIVAAVVVVDQLLKAWVVSAFEVGAPVDVLGELLRITLVHNSGALFGMLQGRADLFALFSLLVMGIIVWYEARAGSSLLLTIALGLLLGGAIGNLIDRLRFGFVVDFVDMGIGSWRFYTYNVADSAITVSILLLIAIALVPGLASRAGNG